MRLAVLSVMVALGLTSADPASVVLRWKFQPGERLRYVRSDERITRRAGAEESLSRTTEMTLAVASAEPVGARMTLSIDRVRYRTKAAGGEAEYDAEPGRITGDPPAGLAAGLRELVEVQFSFLVAPRGEVDDIRVSGRGAGTPGRPVSAATARRVRYLLPFFPLPAGAVTPGASWSGQSEHAEPALGHCRLETTYRFEGPRADGDRLDRLAFTSALSVLATHPERARPAVQNADWHGMIAFNNVAGRLESREDDVTLRVAVPSADKAVEEDVRSTVVVKFLSGEGR